MEKTIIKLTELVEDKNLSKEQQNKIQECIIDLKKNKSKPLTKRLVSNVIKALFLDEFLDWLNIFEE